MKRERKARQFGRREFLNTLSVGTAAAVSAPLVGDARADTETSDEKRKARYQADSTHIQIYYLVNRYPPAPK